VDQVLAPEEAAQVLTDPPVLSPDALTKLKKVKQKQRKLRDVSEANKKKIAELAETMSNQLLSEGMSPDDVKVKVRE